MRNLLNELKRRNVIRVAATYAVVAWVMAQSANVLLPAFEAPDWALKAVIALLLLCFPVVIFLTWAYELTPEGLRRTPEDADADGKARRSSARLVDSIMIIALVIAVTVVTLMNARWPGSAGGGAGTAAEAPAEKQPSLRTAVMPLVGINTDPATELLALGMTDDLIHQLRRFEGLELVGAASSFAYSGHQATLEEVHKQLGVVRILQGSVRISDGHVAVDVQLISVPEGKELWSLQFERPAETLLTARDAVLAGLAGHLHLRWAERGDKPALMSPEEPGVYRDWLTLLGHLRKGGPANLQQAHVVAQRLTAQAPKFGEGHAALAFTGFAAAERTDSVDHGDAVSRSRALLDQALTLSPRSARVLGWRAEVESRMARWRGRGEDYQRIAADFRHALELYPGHPALTTGFAEHCAAWGEHERAVELARKALGPDPRSADAHAVLIRSLIALGRADAAADAAATMRKQLPGAAASRLSAEVAVARGELDAALARYREIARPDPPTLRAMARIHASRRHPEAAVEALAQWPDDSAGVLERDIWRAALTRGIDEAYARAEEALQPLHPLDAALLGRLSVQSGANEKAVGYYEGYFADWFKDSGPLLGKAAWMNAPWFAFALEKAGRAGDARRILDRHLAAMVLMEGRLAPAERALYLAANFAVQGRAGDALSSFERAVSRGLRLTWAALGAPIPLQDVVLLEPLSKDPAFASLLSRVDGQNGAEKNRP
ncbi:MAG TPA: hypothetical protein VGB36_14815 [Gammaproteobacteria bacterium]